MAPELKLRIAFASQLRQQALIGPILLSARLTPCLLFPYLGYYPPDFFAGGEQFIEKILGQIFPSDFAQRLADQFKLVPEKI
jgi:hypothetical protein